MPNYQNGKIYSIRSYSQPDLVYIGSTTQSLPKRFGGHKTKRNCCTSKQIIDIGDAYIELIEFFPCDNVYELLRQEGELIRSMVCVNRVIIGRTHKQYRDDNKEKIKQYRDDNKEKISTYKKQYNIDNKEKILLKEKQYRDNNKESILITAKQYRDNNKEKISLKEKQYRDNNKEKISLREKQHYIDNKESILITAKQYRDDNKESMIIKRKQHYIDNKEKINKKFNCECGGMYTKSNKSTHLKTKKHKLYIENL
tara:strand:+ start:112 stop:876 length:765 start_codon:yes stop_codon:yes gene_type:complete